MTVFLLWNTKGFLKAVLLIYIRTGDAKLKNDKQYHKSTLKVVHFTSCKISFCEKQTKKCFSHSTKPWVLVVLNPAFSLTKETSHTCDLVAGFVPLTLHCSVKKFETMQC